MRHAKVESAAAARDHANAYVQRTQLESLKRSGVMLFLTVLAAREAQTAAQAAVDNWETLRKSIHALTAAELQLRVLTNREFEA